MGTRHSRPQRPRAFWSAPRIATSKSNTGSPRFTDFPSLCACSESSLTNLIGSGLNLLCLQSHSKPECRWTGPEVAILGADQKERGLWGPSSETQGQLVGAGKSLKTGEKKFGRRKVKNEEKSPWGQGFKGPVPNGFSSFLTFLRPNFFSPVFRLFPPTNCLWVSEDVWGREWGTTRQTRMPRSDLNVLYRPLYQDKCYMYVSYMYARKRKET